MLSILFFFCFLFFFFGALPYRRVDSIEPIGDDRFTIESMFIDDDDDDVPQPISISPFSSSSSYFYPFFRHFFPANHRRPPSGVFCSFFSFFSSILRAVRGVDHYDRWIPIKNKIHQKKIDKK